MRLTPAQFAMLKRYWKYHNENYQAAHLVILYTATWFICVIGGLLCFLLTRVYGWEWLGWCGIGFFLSKFFSTIKRILDFGGLWKVLHAIMNWEKVEELIKANEPGAPRRLQ